MAGYNVIKTQRALPIGSVQPWGGNISEIPSGWLLCNGAEINAADYPLLARILRDTYGGTSFSGDFPNYSGSFRLPATNNKALADISTEYFGVYDSTTGLIPSPIDNSAALSIVEDYIGDSVPGFEPGDLGPPNVVNAKTDLNFTYTPDPEGTITSITFTGTAPTVTNTKVYNNIPGTNGTNADSGATVTGTGALFTVVINTDGTYDVVPKVKGSGYDVADRITIAGTAFSADGGVSTANDITINVSKVGNSYFEGTITGQTIIEGFSIKEVFIVPRKLGREHMPQHFHEGTYETTNVGDAGENPGRGACVFATPDVNFVEFYNRIHPCPNGIICFPPCCPLPTSLDCAGSASATTAFYLGSSASNNYSTLNNSPFQSGVGRYAIASVGGSLPINDHTPFATSATGHGVGKSWFIGSGSHFNLRASDGSTSATGDTNMTALKSTGRFLPGYRIPFSDSSQTVKSPNYDPGNNGSDNTHGYTKTLFNHAAIRFTNDTLTGGGVNDVIEEHDHDGTFNIQYDGSNLDVTEQISVLAQPNVTPDSIPGALQITFTTRVPSVSITNLIRAY
ncbi:MAG: phage tail protein [Candidatus Nanopelagicaceae bacterium]